MHYIAVLWGTPSEGFTILGYLSEILLWKSVAWVNESFLWWLRSLFLSALHFGITPVNELKNGSWILPGSVAVGSDILNARKWTKCYDWPFFFSNSKADWLWHKPEENADCWWAFSLPLDIHMPRHQNDHLLFLFTFFFVCEMIPSWA